MRQIPGMQGVGKRESETARRASAEMPGPRPEVTGPTMVLFLSAPPAGIFFDFFSLRQLAQDGFVGANPRSRRSCRWMPVESPRAPARHLDGRFPLGIQPGDRPARGENS